ncbi:MAG: hypothetical protein HN350_10520 [Phycisphaerales bacterium]|jgi:hypothetical protein|nr:hypothetical protein [Phycisphaerales bacterium]
MDKKTKKTENSRNSFAEQADMQGASFLRELLDFICHNKKWWLTPIIVILLLVSILVILTTHSALAPFIYAIF